MGSRRILVVLFALAVAAMVATAGVAFATDGHGPAAGRGPAVDGPDRAGHDPNGDPGVESNDESDDPEGVEADVSVSEGSGISGGVTSGSGQGIDVTETGVDAPPAPVEAPAVAASGPAPDAATAAPVIGPVVDVLTATVGSPDAPGGDVPAAAIASATEPVAAAAAAVTTPLADALAVPAVTPTPARSTLHGLPVLGSLGGVADQLDGRSPDTRSFLSSAPPRSLAVVTLLLVAIGLFLSIHRWADRGDTKLAVARRGPDLARFR